MLDGDNMLESSDTVFEFKNDKKIEKKDKMFKVDTYQLMFD